MKSVQGPLLCHGDGKRAHGPPGEIFSGKVRAWYKTRGAPLGTLFGFFNESTEEGAFPSKYAKADPFSLRG